MTPAMTETVTTATRPCEVAPPLESLATFHGLVGRSAPMQALFERIRRVAPYDVPVLIVGETGTGKALVARALHEVSGRRPGPFAVLTCGAPMPDLVPSRPVDAESASDRSMPDRQVDPLEVLHGGTLLLDEIGDLAPDGQAQVCQVATGPGPPAGRRGRAAGRHDVARPARGRPRRALPRGPLLRPAPRRPGGAAAAGAGWTTCRASSSTSGARSTPATTSGSRA